jgi:hypothetical protein
MTFVLTEKYNMKNLLTNCLVVALLVFVGLACRLTGLLPGKGDYFKGDSAQKAAAAIREKIGKPFNVAEVFIDQDEFRVHAQDPNNPKNLDEYKYVGGFVTGPNPVKLNALNENLDKSVFPFDEINFAAIPEFARQAVEQAGIEGGKIHRMTFQRGFAITETDAGSLGSARWHIEIKGAREDVTAVADPKGKLLGVDLSRTSRAADYKVITKDELGKAQDALRNVLGENTKVLEIIIYEKYLMCSVPNPQNPNVQDSYQYGINGLTNKELVKMPTIKTSIREDFILSDINLPDAADFVEKAKERTNMPDATVSLISIRREAVSVTSKVFQTTYRVSLKKGVNESGVEYDNDGNEIRVYRNGKIVSENK